MHQSIQSGLFTGSSVVTVRGSFNNSNFQPVYTLLDNDRDGLYSVTFPVEGNQGDTIEYKFVISTAGVDTWESIPGNRSYVLGVADVPSAPLTANFGTLNAIPPQQVTFSPDITHIPAALMHGHPTILAPSTGIANSKRLAIRTLQDSTDTSQSAIRFSSDDGRTWQNLVVSIQGQTYQTVYHAAMSSDGTKMIAVADTAVQGPRTVIRSTDGGLSWSVSPLTHVRDIAMSGTGQFVVAVTSQNTAQTASVAADGFYVSSDFGATWVKRGPQKKGSKCAISSNGQYMLAITLPETSSPVYGYELFVSEDNGVTWQNKPQPADLGWPYNPKTIVLSPNAVSMSANGRYMYVCGQGLNTDRVGIVKSNDYGATWTSVERSHVNSFGIAAAGEMVSPTMSADGQYVAILSGMSGVQGLVVSSDFGVTWSVRAKPWQEFVFSFPATERQVVSLVMSSNGQELAAYPHGGSTSAFLADPPDTVYYSTDLGQTFTAATFSFGPITSKFRVLQVPREQSAGFVASLISGSAFGYDGGAPITGTQLAYSINNRPYITVPFTSATYVAAPFSSNVRVYAVLTNAQGSGQSAITTFTTPAQPPNLVLWSGSLSEQSDASAKRVIITGASGMRALKIRGSSQTDMQISSSPFRDVVDGNQLVGYWLGAPDGLRKYAQIQVSPWLQPVAPTDIAWTSDLAGTGLMRWSGSSSVLFYEIRSPISPTDTTGTGPTRILAQVGYPPNNYPAAGTTVTDPVSGISFIVGNPLQSGLVVSQQYWRAIDAWIAANNLIPPPPNAQANTLKCVLSALDPSSYLTTNEGGVVRSSISLKIVAYNGGGLSAETTYQSYNVLTPTPYVASTAPNGRARGSSRLTLLPKSSQFLDSATARAMPSTSSQKAMWALPNATGQFTPAGASIPIRWLVPEDMRDNDWLVEGTTLTAADRARDNIYETEGAPIVVPRYADDFFAAAYAGHSIDGRKYKTIINHRFDTVSDNAAEYYCEGYFLPKRNLNLKILFFTTFGSTVLQIGGPTLYYALHSRVGLFSAEMCRRPDGHKFMQLAGNPAVPCFVRTSFFTGEEEMLCMRIRVPAGMRGSSTTISVAAV